MFEELQKANQRDQRDLRGELVKRASDEFYIADKFRLHEPTPKTVFQSFDFSEKIKAYLSSPSAHNNNRRLEEDAMKTHYSALKLKEDFAKLDKQYREPEDDEPQKRYYSKTKSTDFGSKTRQGQQTSSIPREEKHSDSKDSHNIEELQKRLAYLKNKRLEFERKKYVKINILFVNFRAWALEETAQVKSSNKTMVYH